MLFVTGESDELSAGSFLHFETASLLCFAVILLSGRNVDEACIVTSGAWDFSGESILLILCEFIYFTASVRLCGQR